MYLQFYGLREAPFSPTPDPKFLFQSARHREALAQLVYGVRERKGFIVLSGEIGTGKTTLLRTLLERLDDEHPVAYVHNSSLPWEGMLEYILHDWGVKTNDATQAQRLVNLNEFLIEQHRCAATSAPSAPRKRASTSGTGCGWPGPPTPGSSPTAPSSASPNTVAASRA